jgi:hypothetical protein
VAVDVQREANGRVAEPFAHDLRVDTGLQGKAGPGVAQSVERDTPTGERLDVGCKELADTVGVEWPAVFLAEDEPIGAVPRTECQPLGGLCFPVFPECSDRGGVERRPV